MSQTPSDTLKSSTRARAELLSKQETKGEPKRTLEERLVRHRRFLSNDAQNPGTAGALASKLTPETGSHENSKNLQSAQKGVDAHGGSGGKHRRTQSNLVDNYSTIQASLKSNKPRDINQLVEKAASKLTFKKQKKPTDLSKPESTTKDKVSMANGAPLGDYPQYFSPNSLSTIGQKKGVSTSNKISAISKAISSGKIKSIKDSPMKVSTKPSTSKQASSKSKQNSSKGHKPNKFSVSSNTNPLDAILSGNYVPSHKRVQSGDFKASLKGIIKANQSKNVDESKNSWALGLKANKYLLTEGLIRASKRMESKKDAKNKEGKSISKKLSPQTTMEVKKPPAKPNPKPKHAEEGKHRRIPSLPISNPTANLIQSMNLPISTDNKVMTMTPGESRKNSPRVKSPKLLTHTSRQGSFISVKEEDSGHQLNPEQHMFSQMLYSKQKEKGDMDEPSQKNIELNFCDISEDASRQGNTARRRGTLNNTQRSHRSTMGGLENLLPGVQSSFQQTEVPRFSGNNSFHSQSIQIDIPVPTAANNVSANHNLENSIDVARSSLRPSLYMPAADSNASQSRTRAPPASQNNDGLRSQQEEVFRDINEIPIVYLKLNLVQTIKDYYKGGTAVALGKDIATSLDFYKLVKKIGAGSFGKVYMAVSVLTGKEVAIKKFEKAKIPTKQAKLKILQEIEILTMLDHPNIARILEVFENKGNIFCVMEYAKEGDLLELIRNKGPLTEHLAKFITIQVAHGLKHCHSRRILHRDIKLDNVLLSNNFIAKICDFGISKEVREGEILREDCGTPAYTAPEVISGKGYSGFQADIWSLGVMLYVMVTGRVPFKDMSKGIENLHLLIQKGEFTFPSNSNLSPLLKDLIEQMVCVDPMKRITVDKLILHPWFDDPMISQLTGFLKEDNSESHIEYAVKKVCEFGFPESAVKRAIGSKPPTLNHLHCCFQLYKHN